MEFSFFSNKRWLTISLTLCSLVMTNPGLAQGFQSVPQIPAFLPTIDEIPAGRQMPLDGVWLIPSNGKQLRIQSGRAYALEEWLHMFVFKVRPGMVTVDKIVPTAPGEYKGDELLLMGEATMTVKADRNIAVHVDMAVGSADFNLVPVRLDNPKWYDQEMLAAGLEPPQPEQVEAPESGYQPSAPPAYQPTPAPK